MSGKLTEVHQSNMLDWIMHSMDSPEPVSSNPRNGLITVPSVNFDMFKLSIRLVDPQVCNNQI